MGARCGQPGAGKPCAQRRGRRSAKLTGIASGGTDWRNITVVSQQGSPLKSLRHRTADKTPDHKVGAPGHLCCGIVPSGFYAFSEAMSREKSTAIVCFLIEGARHGESKNA